jgi:3-phenylpropionate/cinnamic acid dioxygenase small subunit
MRGSREAIEHLIFTYARRVDAADWEGLGELFADARVGASTSDDVAEGAEAVANLWRGVNKVHPDGTLRMRTRHLITNLDLDIDDDAGRATVESYFMVFQQTDALALQPIAGGRYTDTFTRVDGEWRFEEKYIWVDQVGDTSDHLVVDLAAGVHFADYGA